MGGGWVVEWLAGGVGEVVVTVVYEGFLSFRCEPLCSCVYQKVERRAGTTF